METKEQKIVRDALWAGATPAEVIRSVKTKPGAPAWRVARADRVRVEAVKSAHMRVMDAQTDCTKQAMWGDAEDRAKARSHLKKRQRELEEAQNI